VEQQHEGGSAVTSTRFQAKNESANRTPFWVLLSVVVGFMLPVCSCATLIAVSFTSLGFAGAGRSSPGVGDAVAIVRAVGTITSSDETRFGPGATSGVVMADLKAAAEDPTVKAIVLRVDSPGGSVTGSAQIYEVVRDLEKPVVVSMAATAASGGYYISAPADYIYARPDTVTGSLGVILTLFNAEELLADLGVEVVMITSGRNKALGSPWETLTPEQQEILDEFVDESYAEFVRIVADGRNLPEATVRELADGRIYTGRQALALGLVDDLGDLQQAIDKAAELGGISGQPRLVEYERLPGLQQFLTGFSSQLTQSDADRIRSVIEKFTLPAIEYRYVGPASN
jgi:protease IV